MKGKSEAPIARIDPTAVCSAPQKFIRCQIERAALQILVAVIFHFVIRNLNPDIVRAAVLTDTEDLKKQGERVPDQHIPNYTGKCGRHT